VTSSKDRWLGDYSIGLTIPGKLGCPNKKKVEIEKLKRLIVKVIMAKFKGTMTLNE
jgi:hypothetical protein